jgi:hypothetical protein
MREDLDELLNDRVQFLKEIEATIDLRTKMRSERARRSEILQINADNLHKLRERFKSRGIPVPDEEDEFEEEPHFKCEVRTKTWSAWWDELEGPFTSAEGREYILAKDKDPRSRTVYKLFLDELEPYYTAGGRKYVVLIYTE